MVRHTYRPAALLLSAALVLSLAGCSEQAEEEVMDPSVTVRTTSAQTGALSKEGAYIGSVSAEGTAYVVSLVSGRVEEIGVSVGDEVKAGDFLCRVDDESAQLSLANARAAYETALSSVATAQANVTAAEAAVKSAEESFQSAQAQYGGSDENDSLPVIEEQVKLAEDNYENTKALFDIGAASQIEVDQAYQTMISAQAGLESAKSGISSGQAGVEQARASLTTARSNVTSAQAQAAQAQVGIDSAEYQLTLYNITAPISGVVESVNVTENNFASSGSAVFVISNGSNKTVTFYVTEPVRQQLTLGQAVTATHSGKTYTGAITEIGGVVDATAGQFKVKAIIQDADDLPDGLAVSLTTVTNKAEGAIILPSDALFFENGEAYVYVVRDGAAARTPVTVGIYTDTDSAITGGLLTGDEVITTWSANLRDGVKVQVSGEGR